MTIGERSTSNVELLKVSTIAAWVLPRTPSAPAPTPLAVLPLLQRGLAWKPEKVERLWDSLVRGFPVGSLLVSPYRDRPDLGAKKSALQGNLLPDADRDWHLLDGQQRATAIALGFFNPWRNQAHQDVGDLRYTLWVDLDPADGADERDFVFRLLTRSHPWGYQRQNPGAPLTAGYRREAIENYEKENNGGCLEAGRLPLKAAPFDANAPVPVAILLECIQQSNTWNLLKEIMEQLDPFCNINIGEVQKRFALIVKSVATWDAPATR